MDIIDLYYDSTFNCQGMCIMIIKRGMTAILVVVFTFSAFALPVTGRYNSTHAFTTTLGKTSQTVKLDYRPFNNSVALSACEFHCQTEYLGFDSTDSDQNTSIYKSLQGNALVQLNQYQWLYLPKGKDSRLLTLQNADIKGIYSLRTARQKVEQNYSEAIAAE